jgi:NAD(P)-dependent dehydrogenase (short-subunit alcohol dehydrogenase family)
MGHAITGKVAIITGGASGLGAASARRLAAEGARVVIADLNEDGARAVADEISADGGDVAARRTDIGDESSVRALVDWVAGEYGQINVMANVAALLPPPPDPVADIGLEGWNEELRVTLTGAMLMSKHVIPHMVAAGGGSIIHFASTAALRAMEDFTGYQATKAGIIGLSRAIAAQYGKQGIRSNTIAPGGIQSRPRPEEFLERQRYYTMTRDLGTPEDIAAIVHFLATDESKLLTAHVFAADGGLTMRLPKLGVPSYREAEQLRQLQERREAQA